jgi:hypothetical protein
MLVGPETQAIYNVGRGGRIGMEEMVEVHGGVCSS